MWARSFGTLISGKLFRLGSAAHFEAKITYEDVQIYTNVNYLFTRQNNLKSTLKFKVIENEIIRFYLSQRSYAYVW